MDQLEKNKTIRYVLSTLLSIGNFLNGTSVSHDYYIRLPGDKSVESEFVSQIKHNIPVPG